MKEKLFLKIFGDGVPALFIVSSFFPSICSSAGWSNDPQPSERVTNKSSSKPRARFLSGPVSLSICLYPRSYSIASLFQLAFLFISQTFFYFIFSQKILQQCWILFNLQCLSLRAIYFTDTCFFFKLLK